jgi:hypothetical protein
MTQALDALDVSGRLSREGASAARGAPASAGTLSRFGTFAITFGIAFALYYTVFERLNWPFFTYHPVTGQIDFGKEMAGKGPPMFWYGWLLLSGLAALVTGAIATMVPGGILRRATFFCCLLGALWPTCLAVLRSFGADWQSLDAEFMNSIPAAAVPALLITAAITYAVPARFIERVWAPLLLLVPIGGLVVLGYSLQQYFTH